MGLALLILGYVALVAPWVYFALRERVRRIDEAKAKRAADAARRRDEAVCDDDDPLYGGPSPFSEEP